ncbi:hypothetical protein EsH8_VIII_000089 [Colletotrichum jinshuiense]
MTLPGLPLAPNDFPRIPLDFRYRPAERAPDPKRIATLHEVVRTGSSNEIEIGLINVGRSCESNALAVLFMAIEPDTGNSLIHTAVAARRIDAMDTLRRCFRADNMMKFKKLFDILYCHQNRAGNTILHSAVQTGEQDIVTAAFRIFHGDHLTVVDDAWQRSSQPPAAEDLPWSEEDDDGMRIPHLMFLLKQNAHGRTAAAEARALGHDNLAVWLEEILQRSDPQRERDNPDTAQLWREFCADYYGYVDSE